MDRSHFEVVADVDQRHWWFLGRRKILRAVVACVVPPGARSLIVDVGCGTGANIAALSEEYRCVGIDTSADAIEFARERFPGVEFVCGSAPQDLGGDAAAASALLLMDVLEHVEDDRGVLAPLVYALSPGAVLVVTVPADMRLWSAHDEGLRHHRRYDSGMLRRVWQGLPVEPIAVSHFCTRLYPLARVQRRLGAWRDRLSLRSRPWDMRVPAAPINRLLQRAFEGEARMLTDLIRGRRSAGYRYGVSLLAVLRRVQHAPRVASSQVNGHW